MDQYNNAMTTKLKKKNLQRGFGKTKYCPHKENIQ